MNTDYPYFGAVHTFYYAVSASLGPNQDIQAKIKTDFHRLTVAVVDFDSAQSGNNALVGPAIIQMAERTNAMNPNMPRLGYNILPASYFPGGLEDVKANVGYSNHWGAIVANANCTTQWQSALQTGDSSYDPTGLFFAQSYSLARLTL